MYIPPNNEQVILTTIHETLKTHGAKEIASDLGVATGTIYANTDPKSIGKKTNKLGFFEWLLIIKKSEDLSSLKKVSALFNHVCFPIPKPAQDVQSQDWMSRCASVAKESGEAVATLAGAILDSRMTKQELDRCEKEAHEALEAFAGLYLAIKQSKKELLEKAPGKTFSQ